MRGPGRWPCDRVLAGPWEGSWPRRLLRQRIGASEREKKSFLFLFLFFQYSFRDYHAIVTGNIPVSRSSRMGKGMSVWATYVVHDEWRCCPSQAARLGLPAVSLENGRDTASVRRSFLTLCGNIHAVLESFII